MSYIPQSGSVVAFQGTNTNLNVSASVIGLTPVSVSNSPTVVVTALQGHSVSGTITANQGTNPWIVTGSVQASLTPAANQSVSGTVQTDVRGSVATVIIGGSIAASFTPPANQSVSGTVTTNQGTNPWVITGSVQGSFSPSGNQSVSGTINVNQGTNPWIVTGSVQGSFSPSGNQSVSGTVGASIIGNVPVVVQSSVAVAIISGSIAASFTPPANQSVSGTVTTNQGTNPWIVTGSVQGSFSPSGNQSVSGTVNVNQGTNPWVITGSVQGSFSPSGNQSVSGTVGASVIGLTPVAVTNIPSISGTVQVGNFPTSQNVSGSVVGFQGGTQITSVVSSIPSSLLAGVYAQRNDTVASFLGGNLTWNPFATDSAGRVLTKAFSPEESRLDVATSIVSTSVTALFTSVTGLRNYVTDVQIANTGSVATLITFKDGSTSVLGYTIAPGGGGSNITMAMPMRTAPAQDFVFQAATASSVLYVTAKGYKAP